MKYVAKNILNKYQRERFKKRRYIKQMVKTGITDNSSILNISQAVMNIKRTKSLQKDIKS